MLDFDDNHTWEPGLTAAVGELLTDRVVDQLVTASPEYIEDACELLFSYADRARPASTWSVVSLRFRLPLFPEVHSV